MTSKNVFQITSACKSNFWKNWDKLNSKGIRIDRGDDVGPEGKIFICVMGCPNISKIQCRLEEKTSVCVGM